MCRERLFFGSVLGICIVVAELSTCGFTRAAVIRLEDIVAACKEMEHKIQDIVIEYEEEASEMTPEEVNELRRELGLPIMIKSIKPSMNKLILGRSRKIVDANDPNSLLFDLFLFETRQALTDGQHIWQMHRIEAWDGTAGYSFESDAGPKAPFASGIISKEYEPSLFDLSISPLGFTVYWGPLSGMFINNRPLSVVLAEAGTLDPNVLEVNGFKAVRVDLWNISRKLVIASAYFAIEHGYTPVRFEYISDLRPDGPKMVITARDVLSLEEVQPGLWFPSSWLSSSPTRRWPSWTRYVCKDKILVNQGLTEKDFVVKFPSGTRVRDMVKGVRYVAK